ncbi:MAG: hypothetical protein ABSD20_05445 [Terriglobales bacterium]|jgi:hypothetical protein
MSKPAGKTFQQMWKQMDHEQRRRAAKGFFSATEQLMEQRAVTNIIAARLNLRPQTAAKLPPEKKANYLAGISSLDEHLVGALVRAELFSQHKPMLAMFLDELQIPHKEGAISVESVPPPSAEALNAAAEKIRATFDPAAVEFYFSALLASDPVTWANLGSDQQSAIQDPPNNN